MVRLSTHSPAFARPRKARLRQRRAAAAASERSRRVADEQRRRMERLDQARAEVGRELDSMRTAQLHIPRRTRDVTPRPTSEPLNTISRRSMRLSIPRPTSPK